MRIFLALIAVLSLAVPALAHQQKVTFTSVSHNVRMNTLEVVHRVPIHDAEHALRSLGINAGDIIANIDSRRAFARYVSDRFEIRHDGQPVVLTLLGSEMEGGYLFVYQEAESPGRGAELYVRSQILTDVSSSQENRVNLGTRASVETLIFRPGDGRKRATLR